MLGVLLIVIAGLFGWWLWEKNQRKAYPVPPGHQSDIEIPHDQEFELYHNALSLCSMKSRVCMAELKIPYKSHHIDLIETGSYENISRHFLKVNPGGTVPVLVHDGHPIYESHEQIRYAADYAAARASDQAPAGSVSLIPDDPALREQMEHWIDLSSLTHDPIEHGDESAGNAVPGLTLPIFSSMIEKIPYRNILVGVLFHFDLKRPFIFLMFKFRKLASLHQLTPAMKILSRSRRQMNTHLDALEQQLEQSGGPWILGETFSLADVSWLVIFERLAQVDSLHVFARNDLRPRCAEYWERLTKRPSYQEAILDQSHPMISYGTQRIFDEKKDNPALRAALEGTGATT